MNQGEAHLQQSAQQLKELHYTVIQVLNEGELKEFQAWYKDACVNAPERVPGLTEKDRIVLGGVGYNPLASVYYHPNMRALHQKAYEKVIPVLKQVFSDQPGLFYSMTPDRAMFRVTGQQDSLNPATLWHQDAAPNALDDDYIFGGWISLTDEEQMLRLIPGTANENHPLFQILGRQKANGEGFAIFDKVDRQRVQAYWSEHHGPKDDIRIPPGHIVVFFEKGVHTVYKNKTLKTLKTLPKKSESKVAKGPMIRVHTSFVVSKSDVPLHDRPLLRATKKEKKKNMLLVQHFKDQRLVPVRSGQDTETFNGHHVRFHKQKIADLSKTFSEPCLINKHGSLVVRQTLPSMKELFDLSGCAIQMHPEMTEEEIAIFIPSNV